MLKRLEHQGCRLYIPSAPTWANDAANYTGRQCLRQTSWLKFAHNEPMGHSVLVPPAWLLQKRLALAVDAMRDVSANCSKVGSSVKVGGI
eukprot:scaffold528134_cov19-Prasinocladus_malaysianus.AAC.1